MCVAGSSPALRTVPCKRLNQIAVRHLGHQAVRVDDKMVQLIGSLPPVEVWLCLMVISNGHKISVVTVQIGTSGKELPAVRASRPYYDSIGDLRQW